MMARHPDLSALRPRAALARSRLVLVGLILSARHAECGFDAVIADRHPPRSDGI